MSEFEDLILEEEELFSNPTTRLPICIVLDSSILMSIDRKILEINESIKNWIKQASEDEYAKDAIELCIVTHNRTEGVVNMPFTPILKANYNAIEADGAPRIEKAIMLGVEKIAERTSYYAENGVNYHNVRMIIISSGKIISTSIIENVYKKIKNSSIGDTIRIDIYCTDNNYDKILGVLSEKGIKDFKDMKVNDFFDFVSRSNKEIIVSRISESYEQSPDLFMA